MGGELLDKGLHAATRLASANCADNSHACEKPALRDDEPTWCFRGHWLARIVNLADNEKHVLAMSRIGITRQAARCDLSMCFESEDVKARKKDRIHDVGRREKEHGV